MTFIVGLTGGIGSGKSTAANCFAELGVTIIDADVIAREVVVPGSIALNKITAHFGRDILAADGSLQRAKLSEIIFNNPVERDWLEKLLHPLILEMMHQRAKQAASPYCIFVIPLLLEKNLRSGVNRVLIIDAPEDLQIARVQEREQLTIDQIKAIMAAQISREQRLALADDVIENTGHLADLKHQVEQLHQKYLQLANLKNL